MPNGLAIQAVHLADVPAEKITPEMAETGAKFYAVEVTVANHSERAPVYVASTITAIRYERATRILQLSFGSADAQDTRFACPPRPTPHTQIASGETATVVDQLVSPIGLLDESAEGAAQHRSIAVETDVDGIECLVAYSLEAPATVVDLTASVPISDVKRHQVRGKWLRGADAG